MVRVPMVNTYRDRSSLWFLWRLLCVILLACILRIVLFDSWIVIATPLVLGCVLEFISFLFDDWKIHFLIAGYLVGGMGCYVFLPVASDFLRTKAPYFSGALERRAKATDVQAGNVVDPKLPPELTQKMIQDEKNARNKFGEDLAEEKKKLLRKMRQSKRSIVQSDVDRLRQIDEEIALLEEGSIDKAYEMELQRKNQNAEQKVPVQTAPLISIVETVDHSSSQSVTASDIIPKQSTPVEEPLLISVKTNPTITVFCKKDSYVRVVLMRRIDPDRDFEVDCQLMDDIIATNGDTLVARGDIFPLHVSVSLYDGKRILNLIPFFMHSAWGAQIIVPAVFAQEYVGLIEAHSQINLIFNRDISYKKPVFTSLD